MIVTKKRDRKISFWLLTGYRSYAILQMKRGNSLITSKETNNETEKIDSSDIARCDNGGVLVGLLYDFSAKDVEGERYV